MQLIKPNTKIDFMGRRNLFALISLALVVISIILVIYPGPKYGIDFTGGTQILIPFGEGVEIAQIRAALNKATFTNAEVVRYGAEDNRFLITVQETSPINDETVDQIRTEVSSTFSGQSMVEESFRISSSGDQLTVRFGEEIDIERFEKVLRDGGLQVRAHHADEVTNTQEGETAQACDAPVCRLLPLSEFKYEANLVGISGLVLRGLREEIGEEEVSDPDHTIYVGPKVGSQLKTAGIMSVVYALGFIMLYIAVRFDLRFAPGAVVALIHDVIITMGVFVVIRHEVSLPIIAAILTIIGYSLNDTIVVFDRIRENFQKLRERELSLVVNQSINETLSRTLLTSITTMITVVAIFVFGGGLIKDFALALIIGVVVGTYSSIFVASPVVVYLDKRFFHKQAAG
jgi:preprotein translocase subunit SecF